MHVVELHQCDETSLVVFLSVWQRFIKHSPLSIQLHLLEKNGKQTTKMVSYCAYHRYAILKTSLFLLFPFLSTIAFLHFIFSQHLSFCNCALAHTHTHLKFSLSLILFLAFHLNHIYYLQGSKSRHCFDYANPSWGHFNQKPSPKGKRWIKVNLI